MRVVADSHTLVWYLLDDERSRLSSTARAALGQAEADEGIAGSVASLVDLWYVTQTTGAVSPATLHAVGDLLADPTSALDLVPIGAEVAAAYQAIPLSVLRDPWDRFIMATAQTLGTPLVTADSAITASGLVEVIW